MIKKLSVATALWTMALNHSSQIQTQTPINKNNPVLSNLWSAINTGSVSALEEALAQGANPEAFNEHGRPALVHAAHLKHAHIAQCLLKHCVNVNNASKYGCTALMWAARNGENDLVKILLDHGAILDATNDDGDTALHEAARYGHLSVVQTLCAKGASRTLVNKEKRTALEEAVFQKNSDVVTSLSKNVNLQAKIIAHRGASAYEPENSIAAFQKAAALNAWAIELDIRRCKSGELVLLHDADIFRVTGVHSLVQDMTLQELQAIKLKNGEPIPTLEAALDAINGKCNIILDLKEENIAQDVVRIIKTYTAKGTWTYDQFLATGFEHRELQAPQSLLPSIKLIPAVVGTPHKLGQFASEMGAYAVCFLDVVFSQALFNDLKKRGIKAWVYLTDENETNIKKFLAMNVDALMVNAPDKAQSLAIEFSKKEHPKGNEAMITETTKAWSAYLDTVKNWKDLIQGVTPRHTGCGVVYELPNPITRPNEGFAIVDMHGITITTPHYHTNNETEFYFVLEGSGTVVVGTNEHIIQKGSVIVTPPHVAHFVVPEKNLVLAVVNTPPFDPNNNIDLHGTNLDVYFDQKQFDAWKIQTSKK
jgi:glycerophosphoryl diester phosphodiesterase